MRGRISYDADDVAVYSDNDWNTFYDSNPTHDTFTPINYRTF